MKLFKKLLFPLLAVMFLFAACSKDKNDGPSSTSHKVIFKAIGSSDVQISTAVYGYDTELTTASALSGTSWTSPEITVPAGALMAQAVISATGTNVNSSLKVEVWVDGVKKDEASSTGTALSAHGTARLK
ncbi:hypothetical protein SAMN05444266_102489 [Chitinophaga jiangningensis]|uniref:BACON domain-containing protein n=1 Tax=Chitinophaga jiangningensis TaxID=1419482 RepID=A0A1M6YU86_9BACT|nr:hypothetical protein [Chitinophaga jiangningensis]SHL21777.1 hypothetical protein SAMN05444266_102489 [Chitinophaga jiangningensis]